MNYKLKLNQIREVLGMSVKLEQAKLKDGTIVEVEKLEIGFPVSIVAADGTMTPAPVGEHELEDGTKIVVDENGVITEIMSAEEESIEIEIPIAAAAEEDKPAETTEMENKMEEKIKMLFAAIEEVATEVKSIRDEMGAMKTKMEKFSKEPAGTKVPKNTAPAAELTGDSVDARLANIAELKKSFKK
jgi:hypothetical protein